MPHTVVDDSFTGILHTGKLVPNIVRIGKVGPVPKSLADKRIIQIAPSGKTFRRVVKTLAYRK